MALRKCLMNYAARLYFIPFMVFPSILLAANYFIGPTRHYTSLAQVRNLLSPGDTVFVDGDAVYAGGINFSQPGSAGQRIVIKGVRINNNRPIIDGGINSIAFIDGADHYTFEGFEVRNAAFRGVYHQSDDLILRDLIIHHCNNGIMGADNGSGSLLLEYSGIYSSGEGQCAHQIYMATDEIAHPGSVFRMQFCWIHDGVGGNNVKTRSERNEIYYNWIEGACYHELELIGPDPDGGVPAELKREDSDVVGNVLWKRNTFSVTRIGGDATGESSGRYRFVNNTILMGDGAVFRMFDSLESVEMHNNIIVRLGGGSAPVIRTVEADWKNEEQISGTNNYVQDELTNIPSQWTGTVRGSDSVFFDVGNDNLSPKEGGPLVNAGTSLLEPPPGYPFPSPLFPPAFLPPQRMLLSPGTCSARTSDGKIDLGAFEYTSQGNVPNSPPIPSGFILEQNYPNPFNPTTVISYKLSVISYIELKIFDLLGHEVVTLVNETKSPGTHTAKWDGINASGQLQQAGLIFIECKHYINHR